MNNRDILRQYVDIGQEIGEYQFSQLDNSLMTTYLRKRIIAINQNNDYDYNDDEDDYDNNYETLQTYELFGAPDNFKDSLAKEMLQKMEPYFKFLESEKFRNYLNIVTIQKLLGRASNAKKVFDMIGEVGVKFKNSLTDEQIKQDIAYSNDPSSYAMMYGPEWVKRFSSLPTRDVAYMVMHSPNPIGVLKLCGDACMSEFKDDNFLRHGLNNSNNPKLFKTILTKYGIDFEGKEGY